MVDLCETGAALYSHTDVMCFTETYLRDDNDISYFLSEYDFVAFRRNIQNDKAQKSEHGLMICISKWMNAQELLFRVEGLESLVVLVNNLRSRLIVGVVYKPPATSMKTFLKLFESLLHMMPLNIPTVFVGDFNDNLIDNIDSPLVKMMKCYGFDQLVNTPTTDSGSLLDYIYFNKQATTAEQQSLVDVCDIYYSDHDATFLTMNINLKS